MRLYNTVLRKQKNRRIKKRRLLLLILTALLIASLAIQGLALPANTPKEEMIFANLNSDGTVENIYVINSFELGSDGLIVDYGDYTAFREITSNDRIKVENGMVTIDAEAGKVYYEGTLKSNSLPWLFDIHYFIDGKEYPGDMISGKSGALEIRMEIRQNPEAPDIFFKHFTLQVSLKLDTYLCKNICAKEATISNAGKFKQLSFMVLPDMEKEIIVNADVVNFEMEGISINGISMNLDISLDEDTSMESKLMDLKDGIRKLNDGAVKLKDGAGEIADGTKELKDGVFELGKGANDLTDGASELTDGASALTNGISELNGAVKDLAKGTRDLSKGTEELNSASKKLHTGAKDLYTGAKVLNKSLSLLSLQNNVLADGAEQIFDAMLNAANSQLIDAFPHVPTLTRSNFNDILNELLEQIGGLALQSAIEKARSDIRTAVISSFINDIREKQPDLSEEEVLDIINSGEMQNMIDFEVSRQFEQAYDQILEAAKEALSQNSEYRALSDLKEQLTGYANFYSGIIAYMGGVSGIAFGVSELTAGLKEWEEGMGQYKMGAEKVNDGAVELRNGTIELKEGTAKLLNGSVELGDGIINLKDGTLELRNGILELLDGSVELHDGTIEFLDGAVILAEGTLKFRDKTSNMDKEIKDIIKKKIDNILGGNFKPLSFVSERNKNITSVQFAMHTEDIRVSKEEYSPPLPEKELSLLDRLLALFSL